MIFRPFHEDNGDWFWWGCEYLQDKDFVDLFKYTVDYLRNDCGVRSFLYCYSPKGPIENIIDYMARYPGDESDESLKKMCYMLFCFIMFSKRKTGEIFVIRYILGYYLCSVVVTVIVYLLITCIREGFYRVHKPLRPQKSSYIIDAPNRFELQGTNQCAGYSSAYMMRHFGKLTEVEVYPRMSHLKDGTVFPKHVVSFFRSEDFDASYFRGSMDTLKSLVEQGDPVIVFMKSSLNSNVLHYVNVVGFDSDNIFIADSLKENINEPSEHYNRRVSNEEFLKLWNTARFVMPLHKNTFIKVKMKP